MQYVDRSRFVEVPLGFMNEDHAEEARLLEELGAALEHLSDGEAGVDLVLQRLALLAVHTREHFLREETAMLVARFPAYAAHKAEHDRVLREMDAEVHRFRAGGDGDRLWRFLFEAVPAWFEEHISSMDLATARWIAAHSGADAR
jgi:hemerythrin